MNAKTEYSILLLLGVILAILLTRAIIVSRTIVRDDLRKQDITYLKKSLEQYYNQHESYVSPPSKKAECTSSNEKSWFFGQQSPLLKGQFIDAIPHDVREKQGYTYTYCVTSIDKLGRTTGYYLDAILERKTSPTQGFDEDEQRKFFYRIVTTNNTTIYRVCGGEEKQCEIEL